MTFSKRGSSVSRADIDLAVAIQGQLVQDDRLSADTIDVTVVKGVVTLTGSVQSHRRKALAIDIAESMRGCRGVIEEIEVNPPGRLPDEEIADNVRSILESHADVTKEVVTVSVKRGVATLQGHVASRWERDLAGDLALGARGVRKVHNLLLVDLGTKIEAEALASSIRYAISRTSGLEGVRIRVAVNASTAVLSGQVREVWQRRKAENVASRFRVTEIQNEITVCGGNGTSGA